MTPAFLGLLPVGKLLKLRQSGRATRRMGRIAHCTKIPCAERRPTELRVGECPLQEPHSLAKQCSSKAQRPTQARVGRPERRPPCRVAA